MKCWGTTRQRHPCRNSATTWCVVGNVRYAMCDVHAAANQGRPLHQIGIRSRLRRSGT